jgi:hypothetical protein
VLEAVAFLCDLGNEKAKNVNFPLPDELYAWDISTSDDAFWRRPDFCHSSSEEIEESESCEAPIDRM